jgi:curli biogenesis system outer membrane secretion channel CsgG
MTNYRLNSSGWYAARGCRAWLMALCLMGAMPGMLCAAAEEVVAEVTGYGPNRSESLTNALHEATRQLFGVAIAAEELRRSTSEEQIGDTTSSFSARDQMQRTIRLETPGGVIRSYRILSQERMAGENQFQTVVEVQALRYASATGGASADRVKLAILPPRTMVNRYPLIGGTLDASEVARQWNQALISEFAQSRKFAVLDREFVAEAMRELNLIASDQVPLSEQVRLGQQLGADFLLVGVLTDFGGSETPFSNALTGQSGVRRELRINFEYRVIDVATREIRTASSLQRAWNDAAIRAMAGATGSSAFILSAALKEAAKVIADGILDLIYPLKVVRAATPTQITLNQGGIRVEVGERYEVFATGEVLIDPDTGESLGAEEIWCGLIEVTRVNPKTSTARLIDGDIAEMAAGAVCRRPQGAAAAAGKPAATQPAAPAQPTQRFAFPGG